MRLRRGRALFVLFASVMVAACGSDNRGREANDAGTGGAESGSTVGTGASSSGGVRSDADSGTTGGTSNSGGALGSGGSGGTSNSGGAGGVPGSGGSGGSGGLSDSGGTPGSGGSGDASSPGACSAIVTFEEGASPVSEIHVTTDGDDQMGDGSAGNPYASIARAADQATPGAAIRVHAGTYAGGGYIDDLAGTAAAPIWIGGAPGQERPVIEGGAEALHFVRARYVVVHDLEIRNQTANGINADDGGDRGNIDASRYLVFRNLSIHDVGSGGNQDCLKLSGINDYFVLDSQFARCGGGMSGSAIDHVGCHSGLIARNEFSELSGGNAVQCKGGSEDIEIRANRIVDGGERGVNMGGSTGFEFFRPPLSTTEDNAEARDIRVVANVIQGGTAALGFVGCVDCLAANNTIIDPDNWILRILQETTTEGANVFSAAQNGRFVNNLVYFSRSGISTYVNVGAGTLPDSFTFQNNLWYAHDNPGSSTPDLPVTETGGIYGDDPQLADVGGGDYSIGSGSPAAQAGLMLSELTFDLDGECFADPPSIGAYQAP